MLVIAGCLALVAVGVVIVVRWGGGAPEAAVAVADAPTPQRRLVRVARYGAAMALAGLGAGALAAGAGGRVAMRLLALTSPAGRGNLTENGAVIGHVTVGGTIGFIVFVGLLSGLMTGALYALMYPVLPRGRVGGLVLGATLLVLVGSQVEPLRSDNFDFRLVGPDALSVSLFVALALFQGMLVVALAGRLLRTAPRVRPGARWVVVAGRVAVVAVVAAAVPGFVRAVSDILTAA
jgi:hypothetical protein